MHSAGNTVELGLELGLGLGLGDAAFRDHSSKVRRPWNMPRVRFWARVRVITVRVRVRIRSRDRGKGWGVLLRLRDMIKVRVGLA
eukprot:733510-Amorphochlora_amoeboformis.AAC.1